MEIGNSKLVQLMFNNFMA